MVDPDNRQSEIDRDEIAKVQNKWQMAAYLARTAVLGLIVGALLYGIDKHLVARNEAVQGHLTMLLDRCVPTPERRI